MFHTMVCLLTQVDLYIVYLSVLHIIHSMPNLFGIFNKNDKINWPSLKLLICLYKITTTKYSVGIKNNLHYSINRIFTINCEIKYILIKL